MASNGDWVSSLREQHAISQKNWIIALLLSILLGLFGADRFYVGRTGLGVAKLLTGGGFMMWWLIDVILLISGEMQDDLGKKVQRKGS
jgi:TM2 domain-containing membrane protein YozV